ncbi:MAG: FAD-dependent oxidoreductase [Candidatus Omnitrophota bacterium]|nr:MAG: FAD-dependent oxidoreductase [Candidatus Omnitrophota bacterium]
MFLRVIHSITIVCLSALMGGSMEYDIVIYGGTSAGVSAALQASRMGNHCVIIQDNSHLGGLTSGGLGATDIGNKAAIGGISREFYRHVYDHYADDSAWIFQKRDVYRSQRQAQDDNSMWTFEPHVAEKIMRQMAADANADVVFNERLDLNDGVVKKNGRIHSIKMESGKVFAGKMFIDATYEGDLLAKAGVSYHVGRESNATYDETLNGVHFNLYYLTDRGRLYRNTYHHNFTRPISPYVVLGDRESGLLPGVHGDDPGTHGEGDHRIQAYNFRICMTDAPENRIPFPQPENYNPLRYELLLRYIEAGVFDVINLSTPMPNRKTDTNNFGGFSSDNIGMNYEYPDGDYETRERIFQDHIDYQLGMMWFLCNDERIPDNVRAQVNRWGLCKDEFQDTDHWPHQLYVREARRMISDIVMTQYHCESKTVVDDSVGLAAYGMDSHNVQRFAAYGIVRNEGNVEVGVETPYPISYQAIRPQKSECENLLVPVCVSSSHIAFGSIRMEPVFMVLGQSAATAASLAIKDDLAVQDIDYSKLRERLLQDKQVLEWKN